MNYKLQAAGHFPLILYSNISRYYFAEDIFRIKMLCFLNERSLSSWSHRICLSAWRGHEIISNKQDTGTEVACVSSCVTAHVHG